MAERRGRRLHAFFGFESLVNMAEEAKEPRRTVPDSIVGAVLVSTLLTSW